MHAFHCPVWITSIQCGLSPSSRIEENPMLMVLYHLQSLLLQTVDVRMNRLKAFELNTDKNVLL